VRRTLFRFVTIYTRLTDGRTDGQAAFPAISCVAYMYMQRIVKTEYVAALKCLCRHKLCYSKRQRSL